VKINDASAVHHLWLGNAIGSYAQRASRLKQPFLARRIKGEFERAIQLDPSMVDARHGLIQFYAKAPGVMGGSMDKAKEQAREIEQISAWRGHAERAWLFEEEKDVTGAERELTAAVAASPDSAAPYSYLGAFYRRQKRWTDAVGVYESLLKRRPDNASARLNIAYQQALAFSPANGEAKRVLDALR
jgi:tetratricopeptide (TPR) repeat protein